jgi:hypothetical protein
VIRLERVSHGEDRVDEVHSVSVLLPEGKEFALGWTNVVFFWVRG